MRHRSQLVLLVIPSIATTSVLASSSLPGGERDAVPAGVGSREPGSGSSLRKFDVGTKDAPVDGKDGKPHYGPFVDLEYGSSESSLRASSWKDGPLGSSAVDGRKMAESNDGVMNDKNRPEPKQGTTGTEGGVSEKDKARKMQEVQTGEKVENKPQMPKEVPMMPPSNAEKMLADKESTSRPGAKASSGEVSGLEVSRRVSLPMSPCACALRCAG